MRDSEVKRVIAVFKTHLDIGFTDYAENVLAGYVEHGLPEAVALAERLNIGGRKRFVWTAGAYLFKHYLDVADETGKALLDRAVREGGVRWHAIPCTTHTEFMDERLFRYGLSLSQALDARFGVKTIAAKLTDVPGHTAAMLPLLAEAGVEFLHIGVNGCSRVPETPPLFRWACGGAELVVNYAGAYGEDTVLDTGVALAFCHAMDNAGTPSETEIDAFYERLAARYPNAVLEAGTLEDFALEVRAVRDRLPLVTEEIGDSWIHGTASDPLKTSRFRRLLACKERYLAEGRLTEGSAAYERLMEKLLLVAEHTWGQDVKKHLLDFTNWSKADFARARAADETSLADYSPRNAQLLDALREELTHYLGEAGRSSYSHFEASHAEQRAYLDGALAALPEALRLEAEAELAFAMPARLENAAAHKPGETIELGAWRVTVGADGALSHLENASIGLNKALSLGRFLYSTYDGKAVSDCFFSYGRDLMRNYGWGECDFGKPGLRYEPGLERGDFTAVPYAIESRGERLTIRLAPEQRLCESYGCPREVTITHRFLPDSIQTTLYWAKKDAIRSPEAVYFGFDLHMNNPYRWRVRKLGRPLSPFDMVRGGNRKLHCVERLSYDAADGKASVASLDAPLVCVGRPDVYDVGLDYGDPNAGFAFVLYNNRWGTNFKQWFDEDMRFAFETCFRG